MEDLTNDDWYAIIAALQDKAETLEHEADTLEFQGDTTIPKELRRSAEQHRNLALYIEERY